MCRGEQGSAIAAFSSADSNVKWQLEQRGESWRLAVEAQARPNVDLSSTAIKLELSDAGETVVLPMPSIALPIDITCTSCKYSKKRGELVLEWPASKDSKTSQASKENVAAANEQAAEETQTSAADDKASVEATPAAEIQSTAADDKASVEATPVEETESSSTEAPASEEAGSTESSGAEETESEAAEEAGSIEAPVPEETGSIDGLKAEDPMIEEMSAEDFKNLGNEAIKKNDLKTALEHYNNGLRVDPGHAMILSNRALCHHKLGNLQDALEDAQGVIALKPDFYKAFIRGAMVLRELKRPQEAMTLLKKAPHNDEVGKLVSEVRPEAEAAEEARLASLDGPEKIKEEGNALFKKGLYEQAMPKYTQIIEKFPEAQPDLLLAVRNNRAACNHQLSNFHAVIEDSTWVLERDPENLKALVRRMIALEPLEKYERALEDARHILRHCPGHEVANKVQHRLGRLVRQGY